MGSVKKNIVAEMYDNGVMEHGNICGVIYCFLRNVQPGAKKMLPL